MSLLDFMLTDEAKARRVAEQAGKSTSQAADPDSSKASFALSAQGSDLTSGATDQGLVDSIVTNIMGAVPDFQSLSKKAEAIKGSVPDVRQRMEIVMKLEAITPGQAATMVDGLRKALRDIRSQEERNLSEFERDKVGNPSKKIEANEATIKGLTAQIQELQHQTAALAAAVVEAKQTVAGQTQRLENSLHQVDAWLDSTASLLGVQQ